MIKRSMIGAVVLLVVLALSGSLVAAQEDDCFAKGGLWNTDDGTCSFSLNVTVEIHYPLDLTVSSPLIEETVDNFLYELRATFLAPLTGRDLYSDGLPWSLDVDYQTYQFSDTVISILFNIYEYTGGAHPNSYYYTFIFDQENDRLVTLDDLFLPEFEPLGIIAPIVQADLAAQMGEFADPNWIETGTGLNPDNYQNVVISAGELIFFFPPYQVAAYAAGAFEVHIPLSDLRAILAPEFVR